VTLAALEEGAGGTGQLVNTLLLFDIGIAVGTLTLFAVTYAAASVTTRPARVRPGPATPDLGEEPPAVVSLLANRWRLTEDASESTLLDLAARGYLELRQPGNDPMRTTIHVRKGKARDELLPYERRVLDRVRTLAVGRVLPVSALTFRDPQRAGQWNRRLHREVVADARARGLSRRRFSPAVVTALTAIAAAGGAGVAIAAVRIGTRTDSLDPVNAISIGALVWLFLAGVAGRPAGERDTAAGRAAAARWLGVREWLRAHEEFADLPPAAVTVWDRYLPYGAALGVTHTASEVLDLGLGDRRLIWSSYGGDWRRVRVRYPKLWARYGKSMPSLVTRAVVALAIGAALAGWHRVPVQLARTDGFDEVIGPLTVISRTWLVLGVVLLAYGGYMLVRSLLDLSTTRTITGEVLWRQQWKARSGGKNRKPVPWLDWLAVDDGSSDRTTAWGLPHGPLAVCRDRDTVTVRVRPWSRRVVDLRVVERGRTRRLTDAPVMDPDAAAPPAVAVTGTT
jgi:hypothetical protein